MTMDTVVSIAEAVRKGERSAVSVAEASLAAIAKRDPSLHAFLSVTKDEIVAQARAVDAKRARGEALGPLAGVPVALKDALCMQGTVTTAASKILEGWKAPYDATVVARLKAADAI